MINYLVNFTLCSTFLLGVYHLLLKNKTTFNFNRYYLLFSLLFSLWVPVMGLWFALTPKQPLQSQQTYIEPVPLSAPKQLLIEQSTAIKSIKVDKNNSGYVLPIFISLYILVAFVLLSRVTVSLNKIRKSIVTNQKVKYKGAELVLIDSDLSPHTFFKYIFLSKAKFDSGQIEQGILRHELTHAQQYHSLDVLFIRVLQAICWFNPTLFLYSRAIQLNHEFIADNAAVSACENILAYQELLLSKIGLPFGLEVASQFNYSITKNRLIMMNKTTSKTIAALTRLTVIPVALTCIILFADKSRAQQPEKPEQHSARQKQVPQDKVAQVQKTSDTQPDFIMFPMPSVIRDFPSTKEGVTDDQIAEYATIVAKYFDAKGNYLKHYPKIAATDHARMEEIYKQMSLTQQKSQIISFTYRAIVPAHGNKLTQTAFNAIKDGKKYGVWIDGKRINNADLDNYKPGDFDNVICSRLTPKAKDYSLYKFQAELMTTAYYKRYYNQWLADKDRAFITVHTNRG